jgi:hypothetical protein
METNIDELKKILEQELTLYERLLDSAHAMNKALKCEAVEDVRKASKEHDECTCRIEAIEEKRLCVNDAISQRFGLKPHANLSRVIESVPADDRGKLMELRAALRKTLGEIHKTNASNKILLTESLFVIAKTFEIISTASEKFQGYKQLGEKCSSKIDRAIINTVV